MTVQGLEGLAIAPSAHRSAALRAETATLSQAKPAATIAGELKLFAGNYLIYRKVRYGFKRAGEKNGAGGLPRFRHETFESAAAEAQRLHSLHPDSTFVIMQEVASIRHVPATTEGD